MAKRAKQNKEDFKWKEKTIEDKDVSIDTILKARNARYGSLSGHARISQGLKSVMHSASSWRNLSDDKKEALDMIVHKIARILNGDPEYTDSWFDIEGYSKLAREACKNEAT